MLVPDVVDDLEVRILARPLKCAYLTYRLPGFFNASKLLKQTVGIINMEWKIVGLGERFLQGAAKGRIWSEVGQIAIPNLRIARKAMRARLLAGTFPILPSCTRGRNRSRSR